VSIFSIASTRVFAFSRQCLFIGLLAILSLCLFAGDTSAGKPPITAIAIATDGDSVVVGSQAGIVVYSWPDLKRQKHFDTEIVNIHDLTFSPNGKKLVAGGGTPSVSGLAEVFAWPSGELLHTYHGHDDSVLAVIWKDNSSLVTTSLDHDIAVWDLKSSEPVQRLRGHSRGVTSICYLPEQQLFVSGSIDQNLRVWDAKSTEIVRTLNNHRRPVHALALRPQTEGLPMVASASADHTVRLWQPTLGRMVRFAKLKSTPLAVAWLPDASAVIVAADNGHVLLIDPDTAQVMQDIPAIDGHAYALAVHPHDGSALIGGSGGALKRIVLQAEKR